jgi:hypothetical protein
LRLQARAYMLAHGANPDAMSEDDYRLVIIALNDGFIGNKQVLNSIGSLTAGVFNYIRAQNQQPYKLQNVIGLAYDYIYAPLTEEQKRNDVNNKLLAFISMMPDSHKNLTNVKN